MRVLRPATVDEMVATFLLAEVASPRTGPPLLDALRDEGADRTVVSQPDLTDSTANALRRRVLSAYRSFPDQGVFTAMPVETTWHWVTLSPAELSAVRYLDGPTGPSSPAAPAWSSTAPAGSVLGTNSPTGRSIGALRKSCAPACCLRRWCWSAGQAAASWSSSRVTSVSLAS